MSIIPQELPPVRKLHLQVPPARRHHPGAVRSVRRPLQHDAGDQPVEPGPVRAQSGAVCVQWED